jgi:hypothetical protein
MPNILGCKVPAKPMYFELDIENPPPVLSLAINPNEFNKALAKLVSQSRHRSMARDRQPYLYNTVYDELDTISCSGLSAMFYSNKGLTTETRRDSIGFRNLNSLIEIYRNNGRNYVNKPTKNISLINNNNGLIKSVGRVIIAYDDIIYKGSFDSLSVDETDQKPFNLSFDFQFTISQTIDARNI